MRVSSVPQRCCFISAKSTRGLSSSTQTHAHRHASHIPRRGRGPQRREERRSSTQGGRGSVAIPPWPHRGRSCAGAAKCGDAPIPHLCGVRVSAFQYSLIPILEYFNKAVAHYRITDVCLFGHNSSARFGPTDTSFAGNRYWCL